MTIWLDLEDLVQYFNHSSRPTGIQRLSFEMYRALWRLAGADGEVRFCRHASNRSGFRSIHFPSLEAGILAAAARPPATAKPPANGLFSPVMRFGRRLPTRYRLPLGEIYRGSHQISKAGKALSQACLDSVRPNAAKRTRIGGHQFDLGGDEVAFAPGDWVVNLGASWETSYEDEVLAALKAKQVRFAVLAYDLIPELFPEWTLQSIMANYQVWLRHTVSAADKVFAISRCTAQDLVGCMNKIGYQVPAPVVLPVGNIQPALPDTPPEPAARPYVLLVGTIEVRKNHSLMLRVWRRLMQSMPEDDVPDLVFAGGVGWLTTDIMQQLHNAGWLDGKIRLAHRPSEPELASLYQGCLFTVYPSLYEGWGLPVTESLSFGKTVAASNRAAIPEAGGDYCTYFDPENVESAYRVIRGLIEHPELVAALEARIAQSFRAPSWDDTAAALLDALMPDDTQGMVVPSGISVAAD